MKKILPLCIFLVYIVFSVTIPPSVSARGQNGCPSTQYDKSKGTICAPSSCTEPNCCFETFYITNVGNQTYCYPKGTTTTSTSCPPGSGNIMTAAGPCAITDPTYANKCCVQTTAYVVNGCENKNDPNHAIINWCSEVIANATFVDKNYCSDPTTKLNAAGTGCEKFVETPWDLNYKTCSTGGQGIDTAIGCIPTNSLPDTLGFFLRFAIGAAGGVILLMLIATGYTLITSSGNPDKLNAVKENLVSIFSGLILVGFSLVLLKTIGADILKLPTF